MPLISPAKWFDALPTIPLYKEIASPVLNIVLNHCIAQN